MNIKGKKRWGSLMVLAVIAIIWQGCSPSSHDKTFETLAAGFQQPPDSVRPGVYWYFMDGNLSREAMTADLESMKEVGIGRVIFLEVNVGLPRGKVDFLSEQWQELFKHAVREAERLGIEIILGIGPGWTGSGGPWVQPEQSMIHLVSSSLEVQGPVAFNGILPVPKPFRPYFGEESIPDNLKKIWLDYYEDVNVLAFPTPEKDKRLADSDEKALYFRAPFSSVDGVKPCLPTSAIYPATPKNEYIDKGQILDITQYLQRDGRLQWQVPAGKWTIMRFGKRNNGQVTRPAPEPGLGFECDKFDTVALDAHLAQFVGKLLKKVEPRKKDSHAGWTYLHMDSWEMSSQNWTPRFREEFKKRRGYDPTPYLPVYDGRIVNSVEESERFLWDLRQTSSELIVEYHAERVKSYAHRLGMKLSIEPYDLNPSADLSLGAVADVPMGEFWSKGLGFKTVFSVYEAASLAHTQNLPIVGAEAFTGDPNEGWKMYPGAMKNQGDWALCSGINRFIYHTFAHKPYGDHLKPGMTMGPYGVHWDRGQTWWSMVKPYHTYISRCSYLLQQGKSVNDILYLMPEGAPQVFVPPATAMEGNDTIPDRRGYGFDGCSPDMLMARAEVADGKIVFPGGATYELLVLPEIETMTPELLTKIGDLIRKGATVVGLPPKKSPSLSGYPDCDKKVPELAAAIWGDKQAGAELQVLACGKGQIVIPANQKPEQVDGLFPAYTQLAAVLQNKQLAEDFTSDGGQLRYVHRTLGNMDIYFVSNRTDGKVKTNCHFRADKQHTFIWNPLNGEINGLSGSTRDKGVTTVPMKFEPFQGFFVVFSNQQPAGISEKTNRELFPELKTLTELTGDWTVHFDPAWGGPETVTFDKLTDWSQHADQGIKYYSGIATYEKTFSLPGAFDMNQAHALYLNLGEVSNLARVSLNGKDLGVVWTFPWQVDITGVVKPKDNQLVVEVANLWINRLIGDASKPWDGQVNNQWPQWLLEGKARTSGRYTFSPYDYYRKDSPLKKSGLTGKVEILSIVP